MVKHLLPLEIVLIFTAQLLVFVDTNSFVYSQPNKSALKLKKCCSLKENAENITEKTFSCAVSTANNGSTDWNQFYYAGLPTCEFRVVRNNQHRWFRYNNRSSVEVGVIFLIYPIWLKTTEDYCIDYHGSDNSSESHIKNTILAFCDLQGLSDFYLQSSIIGVVILLAACFNLATVIIYLVLWRKHKSSAKLQFSIFITEFFGNLFYALLINLNLYYLLWSDNIQSTAVLLQLFDVMYGLRSASVIATSIDILLSVGRPLTTLDEYSRSYRNKIVLSICWSTLVILAVVTNTLPYIDRDEAQFGYMDANSRIRRFLPKSYYEIMRIAAWVYTPVMMILFLLTSVLIAITKKHLVSCENSFVNRKVFQSYMTYFKLFCATELPFTFTVVMIIFYAGESPMSIGWHICRGLFLLTALYIFCTFGCSRKHREYLKAAISARKRQSLVNFSR